MGVGVIYKFNSMAKKNYLEKIDQLKAELKALLPMKWEDEERLWKKFKLEWSYNSNHMEGNTFTYEHTELLLIFDQVSGDYTGREIEEMKAHDVAIKMVAEYAKDKERDLSESFIRELNKIILVRPFWKEAITPEGQPTRREIIPGEYKKFPNSVRLQNGEIFHYTAPEDVTPQMQDLIAFYKAHVSKKETHPLWLAAVMHYKFVRIHPFDDGNGRVARLLMNYVLMKNGYPPVINKSAEKNKYLLALNKADTGDLESFVEYISEQLEWSLSKSINAAQGKNIEDDDDIDKEIELLKKKSDHKEKLKTPKSRKAIQDFYNRGLKELLEEIEGKLIKFDDLFLKKSHNYVIQNYIETKVLKSPGKTLDYIDAQIYFDFNKPEIYGMIPKVGYTRGLPAKKIEYPEIYEIRINYEWRGFKNAGINTFDVSVELKIYFDDFKVNLLLDNSNKPMLIKLYDQPITDTEKKQISNEIAKNILERIKGIRF